MKAKRGIQICRTELDLPRVALETRRNGKKYYYRYHRTGDHVVKECVAAGREAQLAAEADCKIREERTATRAAELREISKVNKALEPLDEFTRAFDSLLQATLSASGLYRRRGEWRKQHGSLRSDGLNTGEAP
jgi:hypothetical protein